MENGASDLFETAVDNSAGTLTVTAPQSLVQQRQSGTLTFLTSETRIEFATVTVTQDAYNMPQVSVTTTSWHAPAVGSLSTEIAVEANVDWTAEPSEDWLTAEKTDSGILVTAQQNQEPEERSAEIEILCGDGINTSSATVSVTQDGAAYVTPDSVTLEFYEDASSSSISVQSNFDWDFSYDTSNGWFTVSRSGGELTVTVTANSSEDERRGTVTLSAGDGAANTADAQITVTQDGLQVNALILVYTVPSANTQVQLPLSTKVNSEVNWGDGEKETVTASLPRHTYASAGTYTVKVNGTVTALNSQNLIDATLLTEVKQWGNTGLTSVKYGFYNCSKLKSVPEDVMGAFSSVNSFEYMFYGCSSLAAIPEGLLTYGQKITTFLYAFFGCSSLKTLPENLFANCPDVTSFASAFRSCSGLTSLPGTLLAPCTGATALSYTFESCSSLTSLPDELFSKNEAATTFSHTFSNCTGLASLPKTLFANCPQVTTFEETFSSCSALTEIPAELFAACPKAESFKYTFSFCRNLTAIPEDLFANNPEANTMSYVFRGCSKLTSLPENLFASTPKVTMFVYSFASCTGLKSIPESLFANCPLVTSFSFAFHQCTSLESIPSGLFSGCKAAEVFTRTFDSCTSLGGESPYDVIDGVKVHLYERFDEEYRDNYDISKLSANHCFLGCTGLTDYEDMPSDWQ